MSEASTHPVYIDKGLKQEVKHEATDQETTMKVITERLIRHGMEKGLHEKPLERELDEIDEDELEELLDEDEELDEEEEDQ